jgi:hypothetical protein
VEPYDVNATVLALTLTEEDRNRLPSDLGTLGANEARVGEDEHGQVVVSFWIEVDSVPAAFGEGAKIISGAVSGLALMSIGVERRND